MIRPYEAADLEDVQTSWAAASAVAHPFLSEEFMARERRNSAEIYLPQAETWVWESDGRVVGFISFLDHEVGGIFVDPSHQRPGIGQALMDRARERCGTLELEVFEANRIGRAFYDRYGFRLVKRGLHVDTEQKVLRLRWAIDERSDA